MSKTVQEIIKDIRDLAEDKSRALSDRSEDLETIISEAQGMGEDIDMEIEEETGDGLEDDEEWDEDDSDLSDEE